MVTENETSIFACRSGSDGEDYPFHEVIESIK